MHEQLEPKAEQENPLKRGRIIIQMIKNIQIYPENRKWHTWRGQSMMNWFGRNQIQIQKIKNNESKNWEQMVSPR